MRLLTILVVASRRPFLWVSMVGELKENFLSAGCSELVGVVDLESGANPSKFLPLLIQLLVFNRKVYFSFSPGFHFLLLL